MNPEPRHPTHPLPNPGLAQVLPTRHATAPLCGVCRGLLLFGMAFLSTPAMAQVWKASTDYSSIQGENNWHYMSFKTSEAVYSPLTYGFHVWTDSWHGADGLGDIGVDIFPTVIHPGGRGHEAARVWESPIAGTVRITGTVAQADGSPRNPAFPADGVVATIWKNGELLYSATIADLDLVGYGYDVSVAVMPGDWLIFRSRAQSNSYYDSTYFDPRVEVTSLAAGSGGSWAAEILDAASEYVAGLDLSFFEGQNDHARSARRLTLSHELKVASNRAASGQINAACESMANAFLRLDGDTTPPDWMVDGTVKQELYGDVVTLWVLFRFP